MKCSYHPTADPQEYCSTCNRALCSECTHKIKGKVFCQDCLVRGAEWASTIKDLRIPADSPRRAALFAVVPGMGAVYNNEYMKALTFFAVFAALVVLGEHVHGVFGFGSFVFLVFTMFEAYRTAEAQARARVEGTLNPAEEKGRPDRAVIGWGVMLIVMGLLLLIQINMPYQFMDRAWPVAFILLGGYLVYGALRERDSGGANAAPAIEKRDS